MSSLASLSGRRSESNANHTTMFYGTGYNWSEFSQLFSTLYDWRGVVTRMAFAGGSHGTSSQQC
jgi:hypothetical protein